MAKIDHHAPAAPVFHDTEPRETVEQVEFAVPGLAIKDLLAAIPCAHFHIVHLCYPLTRLS